MNERITNGKNSMAFRISRRNPNIEFFQDFISGVNIDMGFLRNKG